MGLRDFYLIPESLSVMDEKHPLLPPAHTHTLAIVISIREMDEESLLTRELDVSSLTL